MTSSRVWVLWLWFLTASFTAGIVRASEAANICVSDGPAGGADDACWSGPALGRACEAVVELEEDLTPTEQDLVNRACLIEGYCAQNTDAPTLSECIEQHWETAYVLRRHLARAGSGAKLSLGEARQQLQGAQLRVAQRGGHRAAIFASLVGEAFYATPPALPPLSKLISLIAKSLGERTLPKACTNLQTGVDNHIHQLRTRAPRQQAPLSHTALRQGNCLANLLKKQPELAQDPKVFELALEGVVFTTFAAKPGERLIVLSNRSEARRFEVPPEHTLSVDGIKLFFVAVPRDSLSTFVLTPVPSQNTVRRAFLRVGAHSVELSAGELGCVRIELVAAGTSPVPPNVLLEGVPLELSRGPAVSDDSVVYSSQVLVGVGEHPVTILYDYRKKRVVERQTITADPGASRDQCVTLRVNLSPKDTVALMPVTVSPQCEKAGIDRQLFRHLARRQLRAVVGPKLRDFETWQTTMAWVGDLTHQLGGEVEAKNADAGGAADGTFARFRDHRNALAAQGVASAVQIGLVCERRTSGGYRFATSAIKVEIDKANRERGSVLLGRSLEDVVDEVAMQETNVERLPLLVQDTLSELLRKPYLRFAKPKPRYAYGERLPLLLRGLGGDAEQGLAGSHIWLEAYPVEGAHDQERCHTAPETLPVWQKREGEVHVFHRKLTSNSRGFDDMPLGFDPVQPGTYAVRVALLAPSTKIPEQSTFEYSAIARLARVFSTPGADLPEIPENAPSDYICVSVKESSASLWLRVESGFPTGNTLKSWFDVGVSWRFLLSAGSRSGLGLSYTGRSFGASTAFSWDDQFRSGGDLATYEESGHLDYEWYRHGIALEVLYEVALFGSGPIFVGVSVLPDIGFYDVSDVPLGLRAFVGTDQRDQLLLDFDVGLQGELALEFSVGGTQFAASLGVEFGAMDDHIFNREDAPPRIRTDDARVLSLGLRGAL